jgi:hypothetical protein
MGPMLHPQTKFEQPLLLQIQLDVLQQSQAGC